MSMQIIHQLRKAGGTNAKRDILAKHMTNTDWLDFLSATYDTSINYYVSAPIENTFKTDCDIQAMIQAGEVLRDRVYTGVKGRQWTYTCSKQFGELFRLMLGGSIRAGVSVTTLNKVYPNLIPTFPLMLAKDVPIREYPVWASTKYDGVRVLCHVRDRSAECFTRAGKRLAVSSLEQEMAKFPDGVYDGELVSGEGLQAGRTNITGSVNRVLKGTAIDIRDYTFCVFDHIHTASWHEQCERRPYNERLAYLRAQEHRPGIKVAESYLIDNEEHVSEFYENRRKLGYEGIIVRYPHDQYEWKRTPNLVKKKATKTCVLTCSDIQVGVGKYEGMVGSLICDGYVDKKFVKVKVGSGLSDYQRELPFTDYIHYPIEVLYNDVVKADKADHYSLFLPRFKRVKGDFDI